MKPNQQKKQTNNTKHVAPKQNSIGIEQHIKQKTYYFLFIPIAFILLFVYRDYLSFHNLFIFKDIGSDTYTYSYPHYVCIADYIRHIGIPGWSFQQGLGQNLYPITLGDPFALLLYFSGRDAIPYLIIITEIIKILLIAYLSFLLFKKNGLSRYVSIIGACMVSFSGFVILGGTWYLFSIEALYFVLFLYGLEHILQNKSLLIFPLSVFLIAALQPVDLFIFGCFGCMYFIYRIIACELFSVAFVLKKAGIIIGLAIIGIGMSAVFALPTINQVLHSPRVAGDVSMFHKLMSFGLHFESKEHYGTALMRAFSSDMLGAGSSFKGWYNYLEAPLLYCSIPVLLLIPQIFSCVSTKLKILYAVIISVILLAILFPILRYAFWFFSGDYYRFFSFGIIIFFVFTALHALQIISNKGKINLIVLGITAFILLIAVNTASGFSLEAMKDIKQMVTVFIVVYSLILLMFHFPQAQTSGQLLLLLTLCFELSYMSNKTVNERIALKSMELKQKTGYNDYTVEAINYIKSHDNSFYRINKSYTSDVGLYTPFNDAKVQNFRGGMSYASFNQLQYVGFFQETGAISKGNEIDTRWCIGYVDRPLLQVLCNVKYTLNKGPISFINRVITDSITHFDDVTLRKMKYYIPLGSTYNAYMRKSNFDKLVNTGKDIALLKCIIIDSTQIPLFAKYKELQPSDIPQNYNPEMLQQDINACKTDTLKITSQSESEFKGTVSLDEQKIMFFAIPNDEGWRVNIDGKEQRPINVSMGMMGMILEKGNHTIDLFYVRPFVKSGFIISLIFGGIFIGLAGFSIVKRKKA